MQVGSKIAENRGKEEEKNYRKVSLIISTRPDGVLATETHGTSKIKQ